MLVTIEVLASCDNDNETRTNTPSINTIPTRYYSPLYCIAVLSFR